MNRKHLVAIAIGALVLSNSNLALAQAGSHEKERKSHRKSEKVEPIKLKHGSGVLSLDTSTVVPKFQFDTSTVTPHIEIDEDHLPRFDTSTATSSWDDSQESEEQNGDDEVGDHHGDIQGDDHSDLVSGIIPPSPLGTHHS